MWCKGRPSPQIDENSLLYLSGQFFKMNRKLLINQFVEDIQHCAKNLDFVYWIMVVM